MVRTIGYTTALRTSWYWAIITGIYSSLTLLKVYVAPDRVPSITVTLEVAAGFALGVVLVFRANRAYERWWEARILWGTLVNVSRNLAVKAERLVKPNTDRDELRKCIIAFAYCLKNHLRNEPPGMELPGVPPGSPPPEHVPSYLASRIYKILNDWRDDKSMDDTDLWVIDREARVLLDVCGACERIKKTLMSVSWRVFTRQVIFMYLIVFPWGLVDQLGFWTIPISVLMAYAAFGLEGISTYVEEPFGESEDHLDLDSICATIEKTVNEIFQYEHRPPSGNE